LVEAPAQQLSPFPVDPEVRARILTMNRAHLPGVVRLHTAAMGRSLWARLGPRFLRRIYSALLQHPDFLGWVYVDEGRVRGFIAGTADGPRMMRDTFARHAPGLALATTRGCLRHPTTALPLAETFRYHALSRSEEGPEVKAESMFCSFEPGLRGKKISGLINKVLFDELAARGHAHVKITTEEDNAGAVRQLTSWGFERAGSFRFYGKPMLTWHLDLRRCERVQSPGRAP
jgi:hypothetical protein